MPTDATCLLPVGPTFLQCSMRQSRHCLSSSLSIIISISDHFVYCIRYYINIIMRVHTTSLVRVCIHTVIVRYAYQKYASHSYLYIQHCTTICIHMLYDVQIHIDMCLSSMLSAYTRTVMVSKIAHAFSTRVPAHCSSGLESPYLGALGCVPSLSEA